MEGNIYVGGAMYYSAGRLCPVLAKFGQDLDQKWAFQSETCASTADGNSYAVDMMYADHMNDHIYGLMVPRDSSGNLVQAAGYKILKTKGNGDDSTYANGYTTGCS
jgi:hypothetical protein